MNEMTSPTRNVELSTGLRIVAVGGVPTAMLRLFEKVLLTPSETESLTVYILRFVYVWLGFAKVDTAVSPKVQE